MKPTAEPTLEELKEFSQASYGANYEELDLKDKAKLVKYFRQHRGKTSNFFWFDGKKSSREFGTEKS